MKTELLVLSDLHVGSSTGLLPPHLVAGGNALNPNPTQKYLWKCFLHMLNRVAVHPIETIVINGDLLDGSQPKEKGIPLTLHRPEDQRAAAVRVLQEVQVRFPQAEWFFTEGSGYHEKCDAVADTAAVLLHTRPEVGQTITLLKGRARITFHHEVAFSGGFVKAASLEREIVKDLFAAALQGWKSSDAHIRSHTHHYRFVGLAGKLALSTPCWQAATQWILKKSPSNFTDLGSVVLTIDDTQETDWVGWTPYLYKHPERPEVTEGVKCH